MTWRSVLPKGAQEEVKTSVRQRPGLGFGGSQEVTAIKSKEDEALLERCFRMENLVEKFTGKKNSSQVPQAVWQPDQVEPLQEANDSLACCNAQYNLLHL